MPLPTPVSREPIHDRSIRCRGYRRADGLWDIEGHLIDTKAYSFLNRERGEIKPGEPIHEMWIRLTVDEDLVVHEVEAVTDASPFSICPEVTGRFKRLRGVKIGRGWRGKVNELLGGVQGCTHLVELLGPVGTTAFQTIYPIKARRPEAQREVEAGRRKPPMLDTCHALASDSPVVMRFWPKFYTKPSQQTH